MNGWLPYHIPKGMSRSRVQGFILRQAQEPGFKGSEGSEAVENEKTCSLGVGRFFVVGISGFEPELRRPKCLVLPLHHSPIL